MAFKLIEEKLATLKDERRQLQGEDAARINLLKNRISEIGMTEQRLVDLLTKESVEPEMLALLSQRAKALASEKNDLRTKMKSLEAKGGEATHAIRFSRRWENADYEQRRAVCQALIDKILIDQDGTVEVVWNI
jgi:hypothetical protein